MDNNNINDKKISDNLIIEGQSTAEKLKCVICYNLPYLPQYLECCEQIICLYCIQECIRRKGECPFCKHINPRYEKPNKFIMRTFDEVKLKCSFFDKGCEEKMSYSSILEHENKCPKNPNKKESAGEDQNLNNNNQTSNQSNFDFSLYLHNHPLQLTTSRDYQDFQCNFCNKDYNQYSHHCKKCQVDCCENCYNYAKNGLKNDRIHSHSLSLIITNEEIECDLCNFDLTDLSNWCCRQCSFNICLRCYWKK